MTAAPGQSQKILTTVEEHAKADYERRVSIAKTRHLLLAGWHNLRRCLTFTAPSSIPKHDDKALAKKYRAKRLFRKSYHYARRLPAGHPDKITGPITSII